MSIIIKQYEDSYLSGTRSIWNEVVEDSIAVDTETDAVLGMYILHPNNVGRCGHIANVSYAVKSEARGLHIGEKLVRDSLEKAKSSGFAIMQFNAVVDSNIGFTEKIR